MSYRVGRGDAENGLYVPENGLRIDVSGGREGRKWPRNGAGGLQGNQVDDQEPDRPVSRKLESVFYKRVGGVIICRMFIAPGG